MSHYAASFSEVKEVPPPNSRQPDVPYVDFKDDGTTGKNATRRCRLCSTGWLTGKRQNHEHFDSSRHRKRHRELRSAVAEREALARRREEHEAAEEFLKRVKRREETASGLTFPHSRALVREKLFLAVMQTSCQLLLEADRVMCKLRRLEIITLLDLVLFRASVKPQFDDLDEWRGYKALDPDFDPSTWAKGIRATNGSGAVISLIMERLE